MIKRHARPKGRRKQGSAVRGTPAGSVGQRQPHRLVKRRANGEPRLFRLRAHWLWATLAAVLLGATISGGVWTWQSPLLRVQRIEVVGAVAASERAILDRTDLQGESMFTADLNATAEAVEALPLIASVRIERRWLSTVRITVRERQPWGSWEQAGLRYTIDREGVVLGHVPPPEGSTLIVSSAAYSLRSGERVNRQAVETAAEIASQLQQALGTRAVEVAYTPSEGVRIRTADGQTAVLGGSSGISYKLAVWARVAQEAAARGIAYSVIDLRFGDRPVLR